MTKQQIKKYEAQQAQEGREMSSTGPCLCGDPGCPRCFPQPARRETFCLRLPPELLAQVRLAAWAEKKSANAWIAQAIREKLEKSKPLIAP
jgi:hypothetical protein